MWLISIVIIYKIITYSIINTIIEINESWFLGLLYNSYIDITFYAFKVLEREYLYHSLIKWVSIWILIIFWIKGLKGLIRSWLLNHEWNIYNQYNWIWIIYWIGSIFWFYWFGYLTHLYSISIYWSQSLNLIMLEAIYELLKKGWIWNIIIIIIGWKTLMYYKINKLKLRKTNISTIIWILIIIIIIYTNINIKYNNLIWIYCITTWIIKTIHKNYLKEYKRI
uniref:Uncharacterized protein n=1 Tax=Ministeria vibrans TaxID=134558 RepID=M1K508_MINVI|nr:hypothetical protein H890_mgp26 [Ministeria vibrans]AGE93694.1 hypothetical protein [Ministeria vibrans]